MHRKPNPCLVLVAALLVPWLALAAAPAAAPPSLGSTWQGPHAALVAQVLRGERVELPALPADGAKPWTYVPKGESGVPAKLGAAYGGTDPQQIEGVAGIFAGLRESFSNESGKDAHDADVAAALTLFVAASTAARLRTDVMSDADADRLYLLLARALSAAPEFRALSDAQKQYMRDWFACVGAFIATSEQAQRGNEKRMQALDALVDEAVRSSLGMSAKALAPARALALAGGGTPDDAEARASLAGRWSASSTASDGSWFKRSYDLGTDGKYRYKSERWFGPLRANQFDTVEESGTWTVSGRKLTLAPDWSTLTIRDGDGKLIGGRANVRERTDYGWDLHWFADAGETQLVLRTPQPTARDGAQSASAELPGAYLFSRDAAIEWRY